jgi:ubiquinone/menaquinone biosynthesis C-methylase UbiE
LKFSEVFGIWEVSPAWMKSQEMIFYRQVQLVSPSLEIGFCRGDISSLIFEGKKFDFGSEYLYFVAARAAKVYDLWRNVCSFDMHNIALKDESVSTICMVHVVIHVENIDQAMGEISRVLKKGGCVYFTGYSDKHYNTSLIWQCLNVFNKKLAERYTDFLSTKRRHPNRFSKDDLITLISSYHLQLREFHYFETGVFAYITYFLDFVCSHNHCFQNAFCRNKGVQEVLRKLFRFYYISIAYPAYIKTKSKKKMKWGSNFYAVMKKNEEG